MSPQDSSNTGRGLGIERGPTFRPGIIGEGYPRELGGVTNTQQSKSRAGFEQATKRRQHRCRETSPTIGEPARLPTDDLGRRHHHLLALGCGEENLLPGIRGPSGAIDFFGQRNILWWEGSSDNGEGKWPTRNMASSQVACVNFLLPLAGISGALLSVLQALDPDVQEAVEIRDGNRGFSLHNLVECSNSTSNLGSLRKLKGPLNPSIGSMAGQNNAEA